MTNHLTSLGRIRCHSSRLIPWIAVDSAIRHKREIGAGKPGHEVRDGLLLYVHPGRLPLSEAVDIPEDHGAHQMELDS